MKFYEKEPATARESLFTSCHTPRKYICNVRFGLMNLQKIKSKILFCHWTSKLPYELNCFCNSSVFDWSCVETSPFINVRSSIRQVLQDSIYDAPETMSGNLRWASVSWSLVTEILKTATNYWTTYNQRQ